MNKIFLLIIGGSAGTLCRYYGATWGQALFGSRLPYGTLLVNLVGCLLIGFLLGFWENRFHAMTEAPSQLRLLFITGFLGAFTTFSSYELEAFLYFRQGAWEKALLYLAASIILGLGAILLGMKLGQCLPHSSS
jgi:CrcB protein